MKIVVTGGAGFIGSNLTDYLLSQGHDVLVIDDFSTGNMSNLTTALSLNEKGTAELTIRELDIRDEKINKVVKSYKPDIVMHLAAQIDVRRSTQDPLFDCDVNLLGTIRLLDACVKSNVKKFIFASSGGCIYGEPDYLPADEEHPRRPESPYGLSKNAANDYLNYYHKLGIEFAVLALGNVYGPRQDPLGEAGVVAIFINKMLAGEQTIIYGDGNQVRDFIYVNDVCKAFAAAIDKDINTLVNIGTGIGTSVNEIHSQLAEITSYRLSPVYEPPRQGEIYKTYLDCAKAQKLMGWQAKTELHKGLELTVESFIKVHEMPEGIPVEI